MSVAGGGLDHHVYGKGRPRLVGLWQGEALITITVADGGLVMSVAGGGLDYSVAEEASITMSVAREASITMSVAEGGFDHHVCGRGRPRSPCLRQGEAAITLSVASGSLGYICLWQEASASITMFVAEVVLRYHVYHRKRLPSPSLKKHYRH